MAETKKTASAKKTTTKTVKKTTPKAEKVAKVEKTVAKKSVKVEKPVVEKVVEVKKPAGKVENKIAKQIKVVYTKSCIGYDKKQSKVLESLGLRKLNDSNILPDNDAVRGMVKKINHLVRIENI